MKRAIVVALATMIGCGRLGFDPIGDDAAPRSVTFVAANSDNEIDVSALSVPITVVASPAAILLSVAVRSSASPPPTVASVTLGGTPLTRLAELCPACTTGNLDDFELWMLGDPPSGNLVVDVTLTAQADGASAIASSYATFDGMAVDRVTTNNANSASPSVAWTPSADSVWAIGAVMDQGGITMTFATGHDQVERVPVFCDTDDWEAQTIDDQLGVSGPIEFDWAIGGAGALPCNPTPGGHAWIAIGASFH